MTFIIDVIEQGGYRVAAMLQNKVYIFREDDEMTVIPLHELWGKTAEETKSIIERYFDEQEKHSQSG
jgi:hypothetical protein